MNDYRITYTTEAGDSFDSIITERTEAAARKFFTSMNKGLGFTVTNIELHHENTCATKQQERDTLAAIRQMVEELGPQSYLATAFEGCFEDAESNIENDFGDSMKTRWLHADAQLNAAKGTIEELEAQKRSMDEAEARRVTETDLVHLIRLAEEDLAEAEQRRDAAAQDILTYADDPACEEFRQAVAAHRNATSSVEAKKERLGRLNSIRNAG